MAEKKQRRAIYFDLDTNEMKKYFKSVPLGYACLKRSFQKRDFSHRQGSGYVSNSPITNPEATIIITEVVKENGWLCDCVRKIDTMEVSKAFDLTNIVKDLKEQVQQLTPAEQKAANENELQARLEMSTGKDLSALQRSRAEQENTATRSHDVVHDR